MIVIEMRDRFSYAERANVNYCVCKCLDQRSVVGNLEPKSIVDLGELFQKCCRRGNYPHPPQVRRIVCALVSTQIIYAESTSNHLLKLCRRKGCLRRLRSEILNLFPQESQTESPNLILTIPSAGKLYRWPVECEARLARFAIVKYLAKLQPHALPRCCATQVPVP